MQRRSVNHTTFVINRNYPISPDRVFSAFADPAKKRRWFAEGDGFEIEQFELDFRVGGSERARFRAANPESPVQGVFTNETTYQDIVTNERIVLAYTMAVGDKRISASLVTIEFLPAQKGTDFIFTEQAVFFEGGDGPQMREQGWNQLLDELGKELVRS